MPASSPSFRRSSLIAVALSHPNTTNHERNPAAAWQTVEGTAIGGEDPDEAVAKAFMDRNLGVVDHHIVIKDESGQSWVAPPESFSNSYNAFTLISQPQPRSVRVVTA